MPEKGTRLVDRIVAFFLILLLTLVICLLVYLGAIFLYLIVDHEVLVAEHLPRIQQTLDEQCGPGIIVDRAGFGTDAEIIWTPRNSSSGLPQCRFDWYEDEWECSCSQ